MTTGPTQAAQGRKNDVSDCSYNPALHDTDSRVAIAVTDITEKLWKRMPNLGRFL